MVQITQFKNGLCRFIDNEILPSLSGWQKVMVGTVTGLYVGSIGEYLEMLPEGVCSDGLIDVERIYQEMCKHWDGTIPVSIPLVGTLSLTRNNLDTLYNMILHG